MRRPVTLLATISALAAAACSSGPDSADAQIRALLGEMEIAAEQKQLGPLKSVVSQQYADAEGNDRQAVIGLLAYHLLRNRTIHLLSRVVAVELPEPGRATARVYVAMAGRPIPDAAALAGLRANLYHFEFGFEAVGKSWQVTRAAWRPAEAGDFL